jgi:DNA-binding transcriptional ArsR family regulator
MTQTITQVPLGSPSETAAQWGPVFKALGDPMRLEITLLLAQRPRTVKELQDALGHNQALVSHHLKMLREQGIVRARARGRSNVYEIQIDPLTCLAQCLVSMVSPTGADCACPTPAP